MMGKKKEVSLVEYRTLRDKTGCRCSWDLPREVEAFRTHVASPHPYWVFCATDNILWRFDVNHILEAEARAEGEALRGHHTHSGDDYDSQYHQMNH